MSDTEIKNGNKLTTMQVLNIDHSTCKRWKYADRAEYEFSKTDELAEDILRNGQINPVLVRLNEDKDFKYELFAGSRRWKACLLANYPFNPTYNKIV